MRKQALTVFSLVVLLAMAGCSREGAEEAQENKPESAAATQGSRVPEDNVFSDQVKSLEKAEGVQKTLDDATANQREEIERQEQR